MDSTRWPLVKERFHDALLLDGSERRTLLDGLDAETRAEVEALLRAAEHVDEVLDQPLDTDLIPTGVERMATLHDVRAAYASGAGPLTGVAIGPYRVAARIGRGGMGDVYCALRDDGLFERAVALKVVREGADTDAVLQRFAAERRILGSLEHPGIARLIAAGAERDGPAAGRPWLALELVDGVPLTEATRTMPLEARVELMADVAEAVQHAHRRLVVHRDLKPSNVLVSTDEHGAPTAKLLDFGIAKLLDAEADPGLTVLHARRPMTRAYAAPEQVRGDTVTTATDVYGLGLLLFEVLTNTRPFAVTDDVRALEDAILSAEAPSPSGVTREADGGVEARRLRGDLDVICCVALSKEPEARYGSAEAFAEDLRRWLASEPISARPPSAMYRARRFVTRNRTGVAAAALAVLVIALGTAFTTIRLATERDRARSAAGEAEAVTEMMVQMFDRDPFATEAERLDTVSVGRFVRERGDAAVAQLAERPAAQARLLAMLARLDGQLGDTDRALAKARRAVALVDSAGGPPSAVRVRAHRELGTILEARGDYAEAVRHFRTSLRHARAVYGDESAATAEALTNLGNALSQSGGDGDDAESVEVAERALAVAVGALGPDHLDVAQAHNNLSAQLYAVDREPEAIPHAERALEIRQAALGVHPLVGNTQSNLASYLREVGRHDDALDLYDAAVGTYSATLGAEHSNVAAPHYGRARAFLALDRLAEAEGAARDALRIDRAALPDGHPFLVYDYELLGEILTLRGRWADAEAVIQSGLTIAGPDAPPEDVAMLRASLGRCALRTGRRDEARRLLTAAVPHLGGAALERARADLAAAGG